MLWIDCSNNRLKELDIRDCNKLESLQISPQTDNESNIQYLTIFMSSDLKLIWEVNWAKNNPNVNAIFKE